MQHSSLYCILSFSKEMSELKFLLETFQQQDLPDLLISIWSYADHILNRDDGCKICETYQNYCVTAAKEKWSNCYIDFEFAINNLKKRNRHWVNFDNFSPATKNEIYMHILKQRILVWS